MEITDDQIVAWLKDSNAVNRGMKCLMDRYQQRLYSQIRRMVNSHDDTDDVLQNVFVKVYRHIGKFESKSGLYTWLYRIARNEALTLLKKKKSRAALSIDHEDLNISNTLKAEVQMDEDYVIEVLNEALDKLPEKQKLVFEMRYFDEMKYTEMSANLGTSVGALKASYHHAVKKVETYLSTKNFNYGIG